MKYIRRSHCSTLSPKLLGIYERELHSILERAISYPFRTVVDIGAAEGYYCTGLALRMPKCRIIAFETNEQARTMICDLASLNQVADRVLIKGLCTIDEMKLALKPSESIFVICDAEGAELYLLDPLRIPALANVHILVELHNFLVSGSSEIIRCRFESTHEIEEVFAESRSRKEFPFKSILTQYFSQYAEFAVSELRPPGMSWYWMRPKHHVFCREADGCVC